LLKHLSYCSAVFDLVVVRPTTPAGESLARVEWSVELEFSRQAEGYQKKPLNHSGVGAEPVYRAFVQK
jgi:hypothetical protein